MTMTILRTYSELIKLNTFEERYEYLRLGGQVGRDTFGFDRIFNQQFYTSDEWRSVRNFVITRDNGCDLAMPGFDIYDQRIIVHHMNPISLEDIETKSDILLNPEYLITTIHNTHLAVHYGDASLLQVAPIVRTANDTCPWKK